MSDQKPLTDGEFRSSMEGLTSWLALSDEVRDQLSGRMSEERAAGRTRSIEEVTAMIQEEQRMHAIDEVAATIEEPS